MPIKKTPTGNIPFLQNYVPYQLPAGISEAVNISDMVSYDYKPANTTNINYKLGSVDAYVSTLNFKNITINANLTVQIRYDKNIFEINTTELSVSRDEALSFRSILVTLTPDKNVAFEIKTNNTALDIAQYPYIASSNIVIIINNIYTGQIISRRTDAQVYPDKFFPSRITID